MPHRCLLPFLLTAVACEGGVPSVPDDTATPAAPLQAGTYRIDGTDGSPNTLQVWYPTEQSEGDVHAYLGAFTGEALDAPPPACPAPLPVVVFSHGNGGLRYQSYTLTEGLAAAGYLVVAPDHTGNTSFDFSEEVLGAIALRRPDDVRDAYDRLLDDPTVGPCADPDAGYLMLGHSFGGLTALAIAGAPYDLDRLTAYCEKVPGWHCSLLDEFDDPTGLVDLSDPRATAVIAMAPAGTQLFDTHTADITVPTLIMGGTEDELTVFEEQAEPLYDALSVEPRALFAIEGASHYAFGNACEILPIAEHCAGSKPHAEVHAISLAATIAFFAGDLEGSLPTDPDVTVESVGF